MLPTLTPQQQFLLLLLCSLFAKAKKAATTPQTTLSPNLFLPLIVYLCLFVHVGFVSFVLELVISIRSRAVSLSCLSSCQLFYVSCNAQMLNYVYMWYLIDCSDSFLSDRAPLELRIGTTLLPITALVIALVNASLPYVLKIFVIYMEVHKSLTSQQKSMMFKLVMARMVNSAILLYLSTNWVNSFTQSALGQVCCCCRVFITFLVHA